MTGWVIVCYGKVNPARAGMIPGEHEPVNWQDGKPRASGDDPSSRSMAIVHGR